MFTFKSNYSNLFRGRDVCDCESQESREAGHWLTLILHLQGLIPRAGTWDEFGSSITIYTWHAQGQDGENFCYLL